MIQKTLGVILEDRYELKTTSRELIEIHSGKLNVKIASNKDWALIIEGMDFTLPKNFSFCLEVLEFVNYTCSYCKN
tara:strand:- start:462 stop:689 length:228 start_codon:yes stop_codon:yes gene_type:complete